MFCLKDNGIVLVPSQCNGSSAKSLTAVTFCTTYMVLGGLSARYVII